jgi:hypothetical protein
MTNKWEGIVEGVSSDLLESTRDGGGELGELNRRVDETEGGESWESIDGS